MCPVTLSLGSLTVLERVKASTSSQIITARKVSCSGLVSLLLRRKNRHLHSLNRRKNRSSSRGRQGSGRSSQRRRLNARLLSLQLSLRTPLLTGHLHLITSSISRESTHTLKLHGQNHRSHRKQRTNSLYRTGRHLNSQ